MPDEIDEILGVAPSKPKRAAAPRDEIDDILGDEPAAPVPGLAGPAGARPRYQQPKSMFASDDQLGIGDAPISKGPGFFRDLLGTGGQPAFPSPATPAGRPAVWTNNPTEGDPGAQAVVTSTVLGPLGRTLLGALSPAARPIAAPFVAAGEGGAASKSMGGDFLPGAALGFGLGAAGQLARAAAPEAAAARSNARLVKDVKRGVGPGSSLGDKARVVKDVEFKAGEGNEALAQVADELPEVGRALRTQAKTNPAAAAKTTGATLDELTDANDAAYAAIQKQHGGVPLQPIAERLAGLEERLNQQGRGVSADAVNRIRTDLLKRYGSGPDGLADAKLTAQQIRNIRNDMGTIADPQRTIKPNTRRDALGKVYAILNKEIEDVAENTRGVNVEELRTRNRQISTLIPVRDALAEKATKIADRDVSIVGLAKEGAKKAGARLKREVDYGLSRIPISGKLGESTLPASVSVPAVQRESRDYARRVSEAMNAGMSLSDAVTAADGAM